MHLVCHNCDITVTNKSMICWSEKSVSQIFPSVPQKYI